jgi:WD40 repeat protein
VSAAFSPDGRHVVTATWKGNGVSLFDAQSGQFIRRLSPESASIAFRPDSRQLAITTAGGYEVWDSATWRLRYSRKTDAATGGSGPVAYSPDGRWLAIAVDSRVIQLLDSETGDPLAFLTAPDGQNLFGLAFSPDGQTLAAAVQSHAVTQLWDLGRLRQRLRELHLDWADSAQRPPGRNGLTDHGPDSTLIPL